MNKNYLLAGFIVNAVLALVSIINNNSGFIQAATLSSSITLGWLWCSVLYKN